MPQKTERNYFYRKCPPLCWGCNHYFEKPLHSVVCLDVEFQRPGHKLEWASSTQAAARGCNIVGPDRVATTTTTVLLLVLLQYYYYYYYYYYYFYCYCYCYCYCHYCNYYRYY
jgi:hypothetical protein